MYIIRSPIPVSIQSAKSFYRFLFRKLDSLAAFNFALIMVLCNGGIGCSTIQQWYFEIFMVMFTERNTTRNQYVVVKTRIFYGR